MLKILAVGNSFSCDCTEHLYKICVSGGYEVKIGNLYIGGCSLKRHAHNVENNLADYEYFINAISQGTGFSANAVIESERWDVITLQQCSDDSGKEESYHPYFEYLLSYLREKQPHARILVNETWAYETDSCHKAFPDYGCDQRQMFDRLVYCYKKVAELHLLPLIPVGEVIQLLRSTEGFCYDKGQRSLCRDGFHLDLTYGRYAASAVWFETVLGGDITVNSYDPVPLEMQNGNTKKLIESIKHTVHGFCTSF